VDEEAGIGGDVVHLNDDDEEGVVHERTSFLESAPRPDGFSLDNEGMNKSHRAPAATHPAVPLIFDISFFQMIKHIVSLPSPSPAPRPFAGGTPLATPVNLASRSRADLTTTAAAPGNASPTPRSRPASGDPSETEWTDEDDHREAGESPPRQELPGSYVRGSLRRERLSALFSRPVVPSSQTTHEAGPNGREGNNSVLDED